MPPPPPIGVGSEVPGLVVPPELGEPPLLGAPPELVEPPEPVVPPVLVLLPDVVSVPGLVLPPEGDPFEGVESPELVVPPGELVPEPLSGGVVVVDELLEGGWGAGLARMFAGTSITAWPDVQGRSRAPTAKSAAGNFLNCKYIDPPFKVFPPRRSLFSRKRFRLCCMRRA